MDLKFESANIRLAIELWKGFIGAMDRLNKSLITILATFAITTCSSILASTAANSNQFSQLPTISSPDLQQSTSKQIPANMPIVRSDSFEINYSLAAESKQYVSRIELWCGRGTSGPWQLYDYDLDLNPPVSFRAASEGIWRFLVVPVDINGVRYYKGSEKVIDNNGGIPASTPAQTTIFVDYTQPQIFLHEPILKTTASGLRQIIVQWNVFDTFLDEYPATLYWIESGGSDWTPIGSAFKAFDSYKWIVPRYINKPVCFKLQCRDQAGNTCQMVTSLLNINEDVIPLTANQYDDRRFVLGKQEDASISAGNKFPGLPNNIPANSPLLSTDITGIQTDSTQPGSITGQPDQSGGIFAPGATPVDIDNSQGTLHPDTQMENALPAGKNLIQPATKEWSALEEKYTEKGISRKAAEYLELGRQSYQRGEYDRARKLFELVVNLEPSYIETYYDLAAVLDMQGKYEEAKKNFIIFLNENPKHKNALIGLMWCHIKLKELSEAKDIMNNKIKQLNNSDKWNDLFDKR